MPPTRASWAPLPETPHTLRLTAASALQRALPWSYASAFRLISSFFFVFLTAQSVLAHLQPLRMLLKFVTAEPTGQGCFVCFCFRVKFFLTCRSKVIGAPPPDIAIDSLWRDWLPLGGRDSSVSRFDRHSSMGEMGVGDMKWFN